MAALLAAAMLVLVAAPVEGQRLLRLVPQATQPATVADQDFAPDIAPLAIQVDLELLRTEPGRLQLPTPDGRVLEAGLSVFEDRGGGDLMWAGGLVGAGYDSVVLTVEGGHLVGWFVEPGGARYRISARPDGAGQMASSFGVPGREPEAFCPVGSTLDSRLPERARLPAEAMAVDLPSRAVAAQNHEELDILVVYTSRAGARPDGYIRGQRGGASREPEYETQDTTVVGGGRWTRVALVPAGATSFDLVRSEAVDYRVFAYDRTGFSRSSNTVRGMPFQGPDPPPEADDRVTALPSGETSVELSWTGRWTRAARGTLSIEARNPASGWAEVATSAPALGRTVVTGLEEPARVIPSLTMGKTGFFWFFNSSNVELAVKMLDGRDLNGHFWLLYGGLSDVEYEITVTDTATGRIESYRNESGNICGKIDTEAF